MGDLSLPPNKKISAHSLTEDMRLVLVHGGFSWTTEVSHLYGAQSVLSHTN